MMSFERYKKYNDIFPSYLGNRPKKLVKHCMARLRSPAKVISSRIQRNGENNLPKQHVTQFH